MGKVKCKLGVLTFLQKMISNNYVFYFVIFVPIVLITYKQVRSAILSADEEEKDDKK